VAEVPIYDGKSATLLQALFASRLRAIASYGSKKIGLEDGMKKYMIERDIPNVGTLKGENARQAAEKSNSVLRQLGPDIQWMESYVTADKLFCVYLAKDEAIIQRHAELSGFPATKITEIGKVFDPTTGSCGAH
jgi:hypothetical protein